MIYAVTCHKYDYILYSARALLKKYINSQIIHITSHSDIKHVTCYSTSWQSAYFQNSHLVSHCTNCYWNMALWKQHLHCNAVHTIEHCVHCSSVESSEKKVVQTSLNFSKRNNVIPSISLVLWRNVIHTQGFVSKKLMN